MSDPAPSPSHAKMIIIGSGPAGYTAAIYAARAMLQPILISGYEPGGQLMITTDVENYPGFKDPIQGPWLMDQMREQAEHVGTRMVNDHVTSVEFGKRPFRISCDSGATYTCETVVIATGAKAKWLDLPSEEAFKGYGVSACATCDGYFFRDKIVVVWDTAIEEICGQQNPPGVTHVRLKNVKTGKIEKRKVDGVFVAIGHAPASELFRGQIEIRPNGYIKTAPDSTATNIPGVYAAGDVTDDIYRQAVTAAGMGCMAALEAERWLTAQAATRAAAE